jgi:hypothetical protein
MAVITINKFSGVSPKTPARYLGPNAAQIAVNCPVWLGSLQSIRGAAPVANTTGNADPLTKPYDIKTIYRFGQTQTEEDKYWFHWSEDVDVVQGFINADTTERTYYTGDTGGFKVTNGTLAIAGAGTDYPESSYLVGVPRPEGAMTVAISAGPPEDDEVPETRVYTYTQVNSWGEESAPYSPTDTTNITVTKYPSGTVTLMLPGAPTAGNYNITKQRIYRSTTGASGTSFLFVAELPITDTTFTDTVEPDALNEALSSATWVQPPSDLEGLVGMPNGVMAGFKGNDIYFSEPYRPFAWPIQYMQTVGYPIVGLGTIDTTIVVLTKGRPYFLQGSHPDSMVMVEADVNQACISKRSILSMNGSVFYASPDGLVALFPGGSAIVTQSLFDKYAWQALNPAGLVGCRYENQYVGFLNTTSGDGGFVYDIEAKTWNFHTVYATGGFNDLKNDALYIIKGDELWKWDSGDRLPYVWKSKKFSFPEPKSFSCYRVQAEAYPIGIQIYRDGVEKVNATINNDRLQRLPSGLGTDWEIQISGSTEVYNVQLAQSPTELNRG